MAETVILDPSAVATTRTQVDITSWIQADGVDWGDAAIEAYMADATRGSNPVDFRVPNRIVIIPLVLKTSAGTSFDTIRHQIQAKVALFQAEGGWISRQTSVGTVYADVVSATLKLGGDWLQAFKSVDANAVLSLEVLPDWYGAEITLDDMVETTAPELVRVLQLSSSDAVIGGNYPGRVRFLVDEDDGDTQLGLLWGVRSRYYDSAATAMLAYQAGSLTPLDTAGTATLSGAAGTAILHGTLSTTWTPVVKTTILSGTADLTHAGSYRVWARCYSTTNPPQVRFLWDVGDLTAPVENPAIQIPASEKFYEMDLGEIRIDRAPVGTHRWQGQIQAKAASNGENVYVDRIHFQPLDDGAGRLTGNLAPSVALSSFVGRDDFASTTAGNALNARTAPVGGSWATSGSATDFVFADASGNFDEHVTRSASGTRYAILGSTNYTDVTVEATVNLGQSDSQCGVIARWVDSSNYIAGYVGTNITGTGVYLALLDTGGSPFTTFGEAVTVGTDYRLSLTVFSTGRIVFVVTEAETGRQIDRIDDTASTLATGGDLATGKPGLLHQSTSGGAAGRFDVFRASVPTADAALFASQSAELRTDGMFREDSSGAAYGPVSSVIGDLPRLPVSGLESRKVEVFLKGSRGDFDQIPDSGIDNISAQVIYRPAWLFVQGS